VEEGSLFAFFSFAGDFQMGKVKVLSLICVNLEFSKGFLF
jgi:hypothetical protein